MIESALFAVSASNVNRNMTSTIDEIENYAVKSPTR